MLNPQGRRRLAQQLLQQQDLLRWSSADIQLGVSIRRNASNDAG